VTLTKKQREVVETESGHIVVLAGPGSGKTHTITEKIAYLLDRNVIPEPYGLLAVTFTDAAAREMRSRLRAKGFRQWDRVWVGTFHSFGRYLLSCYGGDIGIREDFEIIEPDDRTTLLGQVIPLCSGGWTPWDLGERFDSLRACFESYVEHLYK
jgi:DNA helicase-2/ATP-dependent DNA helicase PcrA